MNTYNEIHLILALQDPRSKKLPEGKSQWKRRHLRAVSVDKAGIIAMLQGAVEFARANERLGYRPGDDGYARDPFAAILHSLHYLLSCDIADLDGATMSHAIHRLAELAGVEID